MPTLPGVPVLLALALAACGPKDDILQPDKLTLDFLVVDDGHDQLHRVDQLRGNDWTVDLPPGTRDLVRWGDDSVLASHDGGAWRIDLETGEVLRKIDGWTQIGSAIPQPQDAVMLFTQQGAALNAISVDRFGEATGNRMFSGYRETRIVRELANDYLLFTHGEPWLMTEMDGLGNPIFSLRLPWRGHQAIKTAQGTYMVSTTDRLRILEFTRLGEQVRDLNGAAEAEERNLAWYAGYDLVPEVGFMVVANWLAYADDPSWGDHLIAYDSAGEITWSWDDHDLAESVTSVIVLEVHLPE